MPLSAGDKLGHFEVVGAIGQGGMGEVYKARDTRLDRTVAIKVIQGLVSSDPAFRERFEREARAVSSLNHPNICTLHDIHLRQPVRRSRDGGGGYGGQVGESGDIDYMVMEFMEGESLADRLKKGRLPFDDALRYGIEIASALDAAHRQGVVHRDLKPGNVMLTPSGAKLLDFGLAKTAPVNGNRGDRADEDSALPTAGKPLTEKGTFLGTFQYMAPEQLEGGEADTRTDLFSFGALLYEMLSGQKAFAGKSQASLITAIMSAEPPPIASLQPMTPALLDHIVGRCLKKDPESRWQTARDVKLELEWARNRPQVAEEASAPETASWRERLTWILALLAAVAVTGITVWSLARAPDSPSVRTAVPLSPGLELDDRQDSRPFAISPDGRRIVYCALGGGAESQLFVRLLDQFEATPLAGTENAINPIFSPDGQWVAFFSDGKLLKVSIEGGAPIEIAEAPFGSFGAAWGDDGNIVFDNAFARGGLLSVSSEGGEVEILTVVARSGDEIAHETPQALPDGRGVLLHVRDADELRAAVRRADTGVVRTLRGIPANGRLWGYVPSGHLIYSLSGSLWAVSFDLDELESTGSPVVVLDGIYSNGRVEYVATSGAGTLVYASGEAQIDGGATLAWVDRESQVTPITAETGGYSTPRISPDGSRIAMLQGSDSWILDLARGTRSRVGTLGTQSSTWTPDGRFITFANPEGIYTQRSDGSGEATLLLSVRTGSQFEPTWSSDGKNLVFYEMHPSTGRDIWLLPQTVSPFPSW